MFEVVLDQRQPHKAAASYLLSWELCRLLLVLVVFYLFIFCVCEIVHISDSRERHCTKKYAQRNKKLAGLECALQLHEEDG